MEMSADLSRVAQIAADHMSSNIQTGSSLELWTALRKLTSSVSSDHTLSDVGCALVTALTRQAKQKCKHRLRTSAPACTYTLPYRLASFPCRPTNRSNSNSMQVEYFIFRLHIITTTTASSGTIFEWGMHFSINYTEMSSWQVCTLTLHPVKWSQKPLKVACFGNTTNMHDKCIVFNTPAYAISTHVQVLTVGKRYDKIWTLSTNKTIDKELWNVCDHLCFDVYKWSFDVFIILA